MDMTAEKKTITYKIDKSVNCLYSLCADIKATVYLIIFNYVLYTIRMKRFRTCSDDNSIAVSIQLQKKARNCHENRIGETSYWLKLAEKLQGT